MNRENMQLVLDELREEKTRNEGHAHFDMSDWIHLVDEDAAKAVEQPTFCKTAACLAGTAALKLMDPKDIFERVQIVVYDKSYENVIGQEWQWQINDSLNFWEIGADLLGLSGQQADSLFYVDRWPWWDDFTEIDSSLDQAIWLLENLLNGNIELQDNGSWWRPEDEYDDDDADV